MKIQITRKSNSPLARAFAEPLSIESDIDHRKLTVIEELLQFMKREGIKRGELAARMGVPPSRITKVLEGSENLTIATLVRAGRAVGAELHQTFAPAGKKVRWTSYDPADVHASFAATVRITQIEMLDTTYALQPTAADDKADAA
jgi:transcriptional regulator with XRE-family HTH domain